MISSVQTHLEKLKSFTLPDVDARVNKLYFLEVIEKPGKVKVGDTHRDVETRNNETITNAALHRKPGTTPNYVIAKKYDGSVFRDKKFHAFLKNKGYKFEKNQSGNNSEWVENATVEQLLIELAEFTGKPVYKVVDLRPAQHYLLAQLQESHEQEYRYINAGFCVRVGKTIISLTFAARNNWMPVYIGKNLTSQSSAEADNAKYGIAPEMLTQSLHGVDELVDSDLSKKTKIIINNIKKKNTANKKIIFFVDEVDDASHTKKSRDIITPVVEYFKKNDMFACIVTMSGTRVYRGEKILKELSDGPIKELSLEYYEMQILQPETTCKRNYRHISFYTKNAAGLVNISNAMKNSTGHKSLATVITQLLGTNDFQFEVNADFPHWFMKFSTVGKANARKLVAYLNRNCSVIENKEYHFEVINGDVTSSKEAQEYCTGIIRKHPQETCVFITQGMATTSFSVAGIGNSVVFTDNELTSDDVQALHRSATWSEGKLECNVIVITTNESMDHLFDDIFEDETKIAKTRSEKSEIYKELLVNNSMVHFTINGKSTLPFTITEQNVEQVLDKKMKAMTKVASLMGLLKDLDDEILADIFSSITGKKNTSKQSGSVKPGIFYPFGKPGIKKPSMAQRGDQISDQAKEKMLHAFAESAVNIPAIAREQSTTIENFEFWDEVGMRKELFFDVYNSLPTVKDRIDSIFNLCSDNTYLVENYLNNLV